MIFNLEIFLPVFTFTHSKEWVKGKNLTEIFTRGVKER